MATDEEALRAFDDKFRVKELLVHESNQWRFSVRPAQATLGAGILSLASYRERLSDVSAAEMGDLQSIVQRIESSLKTAFGYEKINYLMLMMVDPHVHFHVIPRYSAPRRFGGQEFSDTGWPAVPVLAAAVPDAGVLGAIRDELKSR